MSKAVDELVSAAYTKHTEMPSWVFEELAAAVTEAVASRCATIAMERSGLLNGDAVAQIRAGRPEMANRTELKADQFEWMARAIRREFQLKESA